MSGSTSISQVGERDADVATGSLARMVWKPKVLNRLSSIALDESPDLESLEYVGSAQQFVFDPVITVFDNNCKRVFTIDNCPKHLKDKIQDPRFRRCRESSLVACTGSISKAYWVKSFMVNIKGVAHHCCALVYSKPFKIKQEAQKKAAAESKGWFSSSLVRAGDQFYKHSSFNNPGSVVSHLIKDSVVYLPHATVAVSVAPNYHLLRSLLSFYHSFVVTPVSLGIKPTDPSIDSIAASIKKLVSTSAEYSLELSER